MEFIKFRPIGAYMVNSYALVSDKNNAVIIDAPLGAKSGISDLQSKGITIKKILLTHGHCDHIERLSDISEKTGAEVYIHMNDAEKLADSSTNLSDNMPDMFPPSLFRGAEKVVEIKDNDVIVLDDISIKVIHTPGHTSGGVCYVVEDMIFSGDTLFFGSIGRTDMFDGSISQMKKSLEKLGEFSGEFKNYKVYPGHGSSTTLLDEKDRNPFMQKGLSYDDLF